MTSRASKGKATEGAGREGKGEKVAGRKLQRSWGMGKQCWLYLAIFLELEFVIGRLAALHNLHGMYVGMSDEFNNIRWDWWHWAAIRRFEINKIGSWVTLSKL